MFQIYRLAANQAFPSWSRKVKVGRPHASLINAIAACRGAHNSLRVYDVKGERMFAACYGDLISTDFDTLARYIAQ